MKISRLFRITAEITSMLLIAAFAVSAFISARVFQYWGVNLFQIATPNDIIMSGLNMFYEFGGLLIIISICIFVVYILYGKLIASSSLKKYRYYDELKIAFLLLIIILTMFVFLRYFISMIEKIDKFGFHEGKVGLVNRSFPICSDNTLLWSGENTIVYECWHNHDAPRLIYFMQRGDGICYYIKTHQTVLEVFGGAMPSVGPRLDPNERTTSTNAQDCLNQGKERRSVLRGYP